MHRELSAGHYIGSVTRRSDYGGAILSEIRHAHGRALPPHQHHASYFSVLISGKYAETVGSHRLDYRPFSLGFHPAGLLHRDEIGNWGARFFNIDISEAWVQRWGGHFDRALTVDPRLLDHRAAVIVSRLYALGRRGLATIDVVDETLCELLGEAERIEAPADRGRPRWLSRCVDLLHDAVERPVTIADIARDLDLHPVYLSRAFRGRFGCGIGEYLQKLRINAACRSLVGVERSLADIASATGFSDQSHFTRVFKSAVGCSPGRFRALLHE
jgi:AraC family transcriptional regulator